MPLRIPHLLAKATRLTSRHINPKQAGCLRIRSFLGAQILPRFRMAGRGFHPNLSSPSQRQGCEVRRPPTALCRRGSFDGTVAGTLCVAVAGADRQRTLFTPKNLNNQTGHEWPTTASRNPLDAIVRSGPVLSQKRHGEASLQNERSEYRQIGCPASVDLHHYLCSRDAQR